VGNEMKNQENNFGVLLGKALKFKTKNCCSKPFLQKGKTCRLEEARKINYKPTTVKS